MDVKRFVGRSMEEAFRKVRKEFGEDAVILYSYAPEKGFFRKLFGREKFIIIAGKNKDVPDDQIPGNSGTDGKERKSKGNKSKGNDTIVDLIKQKYDDSPGDENNQKQKNLKCEDKIADSPPAEMDFERNNNEDQKPAASDGDFQRNNKDRESSVSDGDFQRIEGMIEDLQAVVKSNELADCNDELFQTYKQMLENNISEAIAGKIIEEIQEQLPAEQLRDHSAIRTAVRETLTSKIRTAGPIEFSGKGQKSIALVGPTGVGKTTTVAKLAGNYVLKQKYSVGLITIDTYRLGAAAQLEKVASLLEVPCESARNPSEFQEKMDEMQEHDLVFIDTLGTSQYDQDKIRNLKSFFQASPPDETHLVLSANMHDEATEASIEAFSDLNVDRVIFSKLDETNQLGLIINILERVDAAISYITTGQEIPRDIKEAQETELAKRIIGGGGNA